MKNVYLRHLRLSPAGHRPAVQGDRRSTTSCSAPEMVGAVRGIDPTTGNYFDDTKRYIDALDDPGRGQAQGVREATPRVYPRLDASPEGAGAQTRCRPSRWMRTGCRFIPTRPSRPSTLPAGAVDAHCHVFGPGDVVPLCAGAQVHALRRRQGPAVRPARLPRLRQATSSSRPTCHGRRQPRPGRRRSLASNGRAKGVATVRRDVTDEELAQMHAAGVRGVRFNFVTPAGRPRARRADCSQIAERIAPLGWHVVVYFESAGPGRALETSSPRCRPPWWSTTWAAGRRSRRRARAVQPAS